MLVTHSMGVIQKLCDRAMLLERGTIDTIGDPATVANRYREVLGQRVPAPPQPAQDATPKAKGRARPKRRASRSRVSS